MPDRMFHLGWFMNFMAPKSWRGNWGSDDGATWADGSFYVDFAQALERAGRVRARYDHEMFRDNLMAF
jgi:hypothetical protein